MKNLFIILIIPVITAMMKLIIITIISTYISN